MKENTKMLLELIKENPELPIQTATHYEVCCGDHHSYWVGEIKSVKVDYSYIGDENWFAGEEEIKEYIGLTYEDQQECRNMSESEYEKFVEKKFTDLVRDGSVVKSIIIYIDN